MLKAIGIVLAGAVLGGAVVYGFIGRESADRALAVNGPATAIDSVETLNAQLAAATEIDEDFVESTYRDWGATDIDAALQALADIEAPPARRAASLALLDVVGDDADGAERIADALAPAERPGFVAVWLGRLARTDPQGAVRAMQGLASSTQQSMAVEKIAEAWAAEDAERALAEARMLPDDLASEFRTHILTAWARVDGGAVLAYLETANLNTLELTGALSFLVADPDGLLAVADRRSDQVGMMLETGALGVLAESDPATALGRVEAMRAGPERDQAVMMVAIFYAMSDPDGATAWVERMLPASPNARMLVAVGLVEKDPARALEMLSRGPPAQETQLMLGLVVQTAAQDSSQAKSVAESLAARNDTQGRGLLANLMSGWLLQDADAAMNWIAASESPLDPGVLGNAAVAMANRDVAMAADYIERIPPRYRDVWITRMAGPYGQNDLDGAVIWIAQYRGQPFYEQAYGQLVTQAAQSNPEGAAQLLRSADPELQRNAATAVATTWAQRDPRAAANWAQSLSDASASEQALGRVIQVVARRSEDEARALLNSRVGDPELRKRVEELAGLSEGL